MSQQRKLAILTVEKAIADVASHLGGHITANGLARSDAAKLEAGAAVLEALTAALTALQVPQAVT